MFINIGDKINHKYGVDLVHEVTKDNVRCYRIQISGPSLFNINELVIYDKKNLEDALKTGYSLTSPCLDSFNKDLKDILT